MADSSDDDDVPLAQIMRKEQPALSSQLSSNGMATAATAAAVKPAPAPVATAKENGDSSKRKVEAAPEAAKKPKMEPSSASNSSVKLAAKPAATASAAASAAANGERKKQRAIVEEDSSDEERANPPQKAVKTEPAKPAVVKTDAKVASSAPKPSPKPAPKPAVKPASKPSSSKRSKPDSSDEEEDDDEEEEEDDDDDDEEEDEGSDYEDDKPLSQKKKAAAKKPAPKRISASKPKKTQASDDDDGSDDGDDEPSASQGGGKWYEGGGEDVEWKRGGQKWKTLEWYGVIFPPLYEPHGVEFRYDGKPVKLTPDQEEVATMYASMLETNYAKEEVFNKNFMESWRPLLKKTPEGKEVKVLSKCDFSRIKAHLDELSRQKKEMTPAEKKALKAEKDKLEEPYLYALVDGRKEKVGNFRVEPPGLFRGRGAHPKMGKLKARIYPEDVTLNMSKKAQVPAVPDLGDGIKHKWGEVVHRNTVTWLAKWKDSINGEDKCVWLAANSSWKGMSDMAKYEKARTLKKHIHKVRSDYTEGMKHGDVEAQQKSVAVYLIDRLALRVGNEKNTDEEADTVGCCSLRVEHVKLDAGENMLHLNFLGKDSIVYDNTNPIEPLVYQKILKFMKGKKPTDELFDKVAPEDLNEYFKSVMEGLSAKVFRTYNASITLCSELAKTEAEVTAQKRAKEGDLVALNNYYAIANKNVAILCNHQKAASASHETQMAKIEDKIAKIKSDLKEAKKAKSSKVEGLEKRLQKAEAERVTKEELKCVSLGTSKINYNDPRITIAWCKRFDVPIQKQFPKTLMAKFAWAMETPPDFKF